MGAWLPLFWVKERRSRHRGGQSKLAQDPGHDAPAQARQAVRQESAAKDSRPGQRLFGAARLSVRLSPWLSVQLTSTRALSPLVSLRQLKRASVPLAAAGA